MRKFSTLGFILISIRGFLPWVFILLTLAVSWALSSTLYSYLFGAIVDSARVSFGGQNTIGQIIWPILLLFSVQAAQIFLYRIGDAAGAYFPPLLKKSVSQRLVVQLMGQSAAFYSENFFGALANKVSDVVSGVPEVVRTFIERVLASVALLALTILFLGKIGIKFALAMAVWITFFLVASIALVIRNRVLAQEAARTRALVTGNVVDVLANIASVRNFCTADTELVYHNSLVDTHVLADRKRDYFVIKINAVQGFSFLLFQGFCIWSLMNGYKTGLLTIGDFAKVLQLNNMVIANFWSISRDIRDIWEKFGNIGHALDVIFVAPKVVDSLQAKPLVNPVGQITFDHVRFQYAGTDSIFENKTIVIPSGQKVGLVGYSGSGKTTFASLILRAYDVTSGRILIDGQDIRDLTQDSLRKSIAVIPQNPLLFNRSIYDNILYGNPRATQEDVLKAARAAGVDEFASRMIGGYSFVVGEQGARLSGGQRQRIAIARAMLKDAPILIFDEATSQLDAITEALVQKSITELSAGRTSIFIAHRLATLVQMDRILVFFNGKIVQDGTHEVLSKTPGLYQTLWQTQNI